MSPLLIKISKDFATLFTTINPIATLALFAGLTASLQLQPNSCKAKSDLEITHAAIDDCRKCEAQIPNFANSFEFLT